MCFYFEYMAVRVLAAELGGDGSRAVLKVDFENAFNCVDRTAALRELHLRFPTLARWAEWCYCNAPHLFPGGEEIISSQAGGQQGRVSKE